MGMVNEIPPDAGGTDSDSKELVLRKLFLLMGQHLQSFQQNILINRRRCQQRIRRRQAKMRAFCIQQLLDLETNCIQLIALPAMVLMQRNETERTTTGLPSSVESNGQVMPQRELGMSATFSLYQHAWSTFNSEEWLDAFRMSRSTFKWLCEQLGSAVPPIKGVDSLKARVALGLHALVTGDNAYIISKAFAAQNLELNKFLLDFGEALNNTVAKTLVVMPLREEEWQEIRDGFHKKTNMPPVVCGMLATCIPAKPLKRKAGNGKCYLQVLFDHRMIIRQCSAEEIRPALFLFGPNEISRRVVRLQEPSRPDQYRAVSCCVVTPPTYYPLRSWIMKRYAEPRVPHEYDFNEAIDNVLAIKKKALTRLFARWQILQSSIDADAHIISQIGIACCTLHNVVETRESHAYRERWDADFNLSHYEEVSAQHPGRLPIDKGAEVTRNFLARVVSSTESIESS